MNGSPEKKAKLEALAARRQKAVWPGYRNIQEFHGGIYDSLHVSPYTRGAGNCEASVFLLMQDWCSSKYLSEPPKPYLIDMGRDPKFTINENLTKLLDRWLRGMKLEDCYATNLMPFVKDGDRKPGISKEDLRRAAKEFAVPQIEIVQPKVVLCLGTQVFASVRHALGLPLSLGPGSPIGKYYKWKDICIWCQASPGALGCANRGGEARLHADWEAMTKSSCFPVQPPAAIDRRRQRVE